MSKPVAWEVYNFSPLPQTVQYYSLLNRKRKFSALVKQYHAQVFNHGYRHYCCIVPRGSFFNNRYELAIVFFGEVPNTSFIGFRVRVCKETFMHESNSLLLFLKKSQKTVFYTITNNLIHVQCSTNAWELFYLLYDHYLKKYAVTIIGTQFFYHFVYYNCILREKQLLDLLYPKVSKVSKTRVLYKINRKCKTSVSHFFHKPLNTPKSCVTSSLCSKESDCNSDQNNSDFSTAVENKMQISKPVFQKYKDQIELCNNGGEQSFVPEENTSHSDSALHQHTNSSTLPSSEKRQLQKVVSSDTFLKRKYDEIENIEHSTSKSVKTYSGENKWEQFRTLKPYAVESYSKISPINPLVLQSRKLSHLNSHFPLLAVEMENNEHCTKLGMTSKCIKTYSGENRWTQYRTLKPYTVDSYSKISSINSLVPNLQSGKLSRSNLDFPLLPFDKKIEKHGLSVSNPSESVDCVSYNNSTNSQNSKMDDENVDIFQTGCAYPLKKMDLELETSLQCDERRISPAQLPNSHIIKEEELPPYHSTPSRVSKKPSFRNDNIENIPKISRNNPKISSKEFEAVSPPQTEKKQEKSLDENESYFFIDATKKISESNNAIKEAQELIEDPLSKEKKSTYNEDRPSFAQSNQNLKNLGDIGCSSKAVNVGVDTAIVEFEETDFNKKFFRDSLLDELTGDNFTENISNALKVLHQSPNAVSSNRPLKRKYDEHNSKLMPSKCIKTCDILASSRTSQDENKEHVSNCLVDMSFTTAAGKNINVSSATMQKACQLIPDDLGDPIILKTPTNNSNMTSISNKTGLRKEANVENCFKMSRNNLTHNISSRRGKVSSLDENESDFSTAAGKKINISNNAMEAAQKLIQDPLGKEEMSTDIENRPSLAQSHKNFNLFSDVGCSSEAIDVSVDTALVEFEETLFNKQFFEDTFLDKEDLELTEDNITENISNAVKVSQESPKGVSSNMSLKRKYDEHNTNLKPSKFIKTCDVFTSSRTSQDENKEYCSNSLVDMSFTTAAGKNIDVSSAAMQKACQLIKDDLGDPIMLKTAASDSIISNVPNKTGLRKEANVENIPKISRNDLTHSILSKRSEVSLKGFAVKCTDILGQKSSDENESDFSTAAGNTINVSSAAMQKACQLIKEDLGDPIILKTATSGSITSNIPNKTGLRKEGNVENIPRNHLTHSIFSRRNKVSSQGLAAKYTDILGQKSLDENESDFSTAAGKNINISNDAMKAAQKLIQDASDDEKKPTYIENRPSIEQSNKNLDVVSGGGYSSKAIDVSVDTALVDFGQTLFGEKFFSDSPFDEKNLEVTEDNVAGNNSNDPVDSKSDIICTRKARKSLGGRRKMRDVFSK